ncbi:MAG TPA: hypothetical protein VF139_15035 [Candidatus Polarisedimenticolaceae bacterium]
MTRATIAGGTFAALFLLLAVAAGYRALERDPHPPIPSSAAPSAEEPTQGFLYGRITTIEGATLEGRLRFGIDEEAFWGDYLNGTKRGNPWLAQLPPEARPKERRRVEVFGVRIVDDERPIEIRRQLMARFGDVARIEAQGRNIRVTLKSGTAFDLDRFEAGDFDDGVRVWDGTRGIVDLDSLRIRSIELLPGLEPGIAPDRLHGTVRTRQGDFTGFLQWDREACLGTDELEGHTADGALHLRFDTLRSVARRATDGAVATLLDGREVVLSDSREVGPGNRGIYVDDPRYGRVLVSWDAFERVDFTPGGTGPAYGDFPPGHPLTGSVTTRSGLRRAGRLVYDLDESETTETLDAPSRGVDYTIPFGRIASIVLPAGEKRATVALHGGEELLLERAGDLGDQNAGLMIFLEGRERPEYVPWADVERVDFDHPTTPTR